MKSSISKFLFSLLFSLIIFSSAFAQTSDGGFSSYFRYGLIGFAVIFGLLVVIQVADNLLRIEAQQLGVDKSGSNYSIFPRLNELFQPKLPEFVSNEKVHRLQRGFDIPLEGEAKKVIEENPAVTTFAVHPPNFVGISPIPKVEVEVGDEVKAGDILFFDKKKPEIKYAAPVSGEIIAVNRGDKRAIVEVVILADKEQKFRDYDLPELESTGRAELVEFLKGSGLWPMIRQRPFNVVADPNDQPKGIFISTFDSAPLAPDLNLVVRGREDAFQKGLDVLSRLTDGEVHLGLDARGEVVPSKAFTEARGVALHWFHGPHPSGNVGVQIHHIDPIGSNDRVWVLGVQEVISFGSLFLHGRFEAERIVALTGAELHQPKYVRTYQGANIGELLKDNLANDHSRLISGDVLSGQKKSAKSFLNFYDDQLTVVEEGDYYEMFGWLLPLKPRPSVSRTFPNFLFSDMKFRAETNTHGEQRAFVVTGEYEKVLPMDIYLQHLMKAILINDFERMEGLGIYELVEEDVALCEFVCTSKQPLQNILREGLDVMREQS